MSDDTSSSEKKSINSSTTASTAVSYPPFGKMDYKKTYTNIAEMDLSNLEGTSFNVPESEDSHLDEVSCYDACCNLSYYFYLRM